MLVNSCGLVSLVRSVEDVRTVVEYALAAVVMDET
jgi:hypothetical protein